MDYYEKRDGAIRRVLFVVTMVPFMWWVVMPVMSLVRERTVLFLAEGFGGLFSPDLHVVRSISNNTFFLSDGTVYDMGILAFSFMCAMSGLFFFLLFGSWMYTVHWFVRRVFAFELLSKK